MRPFQHWLPWLKIGLPKAELNGCNEDKDRKAENQRVYRQVSDLHAPDQDSSAALGKFQSQQRVLMRTQENHLGKHLACSLHKR